MIEAKKDLKEIFIIIIMHSCSFCKSKYFGLFFCKQVVFNILLLLKKKSSSFNVFQFCIFDLLIFERTTMAKKETPLMKQYNSIKAKYPDALLLFRVGDFYETFGSDAIRTAQILGIVLTKRGSAEENTELAGFPHHSLDSYLPKLVRAGLRVAICDQLEDPKMVKGIVKRGVTELVTPGVTFNDQVLNSKKNNFLVSVHREKDKYGMALLDISTGEFLISEGSLEKLLHIVHTFDPSEIIYQRTSPLPEHLLLIATSPLRTSSSSRKISSLVKLAKKPKRPVLTPTTGISVSSIKRRELTIVPSPPKVKKIETPLALRSSLLVKVSKFFENCIDSAVPEKRTDFTFLLSSSEINLLRYKNVSRSVFCV